MVKRRRRVLESLGHRSNYIAEWRERRGLTQKQLAERIGRTAATISRIETGEHSYTQSTLEAIADALRCEAADLLRPPQTPDQELWLAMGQKVIQDRSGRILRAVRALLGEDEAAE